tara:strand:- start:4454 stop:5110 length:657 start_codon:yes stop_codon:yes gene_type:complete
MLDRHLYSKFNQVLMDSNCSPPFRAIGLMLAFICFVFASPLKADWIEDAVKDIRSKYNQIEGSDSKSSKIEWESDQEPAYGTLTKYFQNGNLAKIHFNFGEGDHGGSDEYYYYWNGTLIFVFVNQSYWRFSGGTLPNGESETIDVSAEQRLYFSNGSLIRHLRKEAQSTNASALSRILGETSNENFNDPEFANAAMRRGTLAPGVSDVRGVENMVFGQ